MQQDLLNEFENQLEEPIAPMVSRFLNFVIDLFVFNVLLVVVFVFMLFTNALTLSENGDFDNAKFYGISALVYISYYTLFEAAFRGKSIGKMFTGTRALTNEGTDLTLVDALKRSASRLVPFEVLSIFFGENEAWHDTWTNTKVVKPKK